MKRIDKKGKKIKLNIEFIHKKDGTKLEVILRERYLFYLRNLKVKWFFWDSDNLSSKKAYNILLSEFNLSLYKELTNSSCGIL